MILTIARAIARACIFQLKPGRGLVSSEKIWAPFDGGARMFDANEYFELGQLLYRLVYSPYCTWAESHVGALTSIVIDAPRLVGLH